MEQMLQNALWLMQSVEKTEDVLETDSELSSDLGLGKDVYVLSMPAAASHELSMQAATLQSLLHPE